MRAGGMIVGTDVMRTFMPTACSLLCRKQGLCKYKQSLSGQPVPASVRMIGVGVFGHCLPQPNGL